MNDDDRGLFSLVVGPAAVFLTMLTLVVVFDDTIARILP